MRRDRPGRIILSRTDNIGDVVLALPLAAVLKAHFPDCTVLFMAREYTRAVVEAHPAVDAFVAWDPEHTQAQLIDQLTALHADAFVHIYPKKPLAYAAKKARIPWRIATIRREYHLLNCNKFVYVKPRTSPLHETQNNLRFLRPFGIKRLHTPSELIDAITLKPKGTLPPALAKRVDPRRFNLVFHPGSNGNGREWPAENYRQLATSLPAAQFNLLLTGSREEAMRFAGVFDNMAHVHSLMGRLSLAELLLLMQRCDGLIASGTGPLHVAAAIGIHTLGLYPPPNKKYSNAARRWQPLGRRAEYLALSHPCARECTSRACPCMEKITVAAVKQRLMAWCANRERPACTASAHIS